MSKDRLLSDEELLEAIDNTLKHIDAGDFALAGQDPKIAFLNLVNTQKRLYAESVIKDIEKEAIKRKCISPIDYYLRRGVCYPINHKGNTKEV